MDAEKIKAASEGYARYYGDIRRHQSDQFAAESRWLTASLFALNAGGLAAISGMEISGKGWLVPAILFWLGIVAAFLRALYSQKKTKMFVKTISQLETCYVLGSVSGSLNEERIQKLEKDKISLSTKLSVPITISSFLMFSAGLISVGLAL